MRVFEIAMAVLFGALGVRSLVHWVRRPIEGSDAGDHLLFAFFVTGRAGLWFALAGLFVLYASVSVRGRAFVDEVQRFGWYAMVFVLLGAMQLVAAYFLGRRPAE